MVISAATRYASITAARHSAASAVPNASLPESDSKAVADWIATHRLYQPVQVLADRLEVELGRTDESLRLDQPFRQHCRRHVWYVRTQQAHGSLGAACSFMHIE